MTYSPTGPDERSEAMWNLIQRGLSSNLLQSLMDSVATGIIVIDNDFRICLINNKAAEITSIDGPQSIGRRCFEVFRTDHCLNNCHFRKAMANVQGKLTTRLELSHHSGKNIPVEITSTVLRNENGQIIGGVETICDDSARAWAEKTIRESFHFKDIIGADPKMQRLFDVLPAIAKSGATLLINGETGTGKDIFARAIHNESNRSEDPFIKVNCAALPEGLLESELFGYKKGAFTDAKKDKLGRFELAHKGTLFLDEVSELPYSLQSKLLQVLDENEFYPLGAVKPVKVDVRVITATNRDLVQRAKKGEFREDLYYRLRVLELRVPPLRERRSDIPLLAEYFLSEQKLVHNKVIKGFTNEAMNILLSYTFPGNVRELKNLIEHAVLILSGKEIGKDALPSIMFEAQSENELNNFLTNIPSQAQNIFSIKEKEIILQTLTDHSWNLKKAAQTLSMSRTTLWRKMRNHGISKTHRKMFQSCIKN